MKVLNLIIPLMIFASLSCTGPQKRTARTPASPATNTTANSCNGLMARFLEESYNKKIRQAVEEKKLVHRSHNRLTIRRPKPQIFTRFYQKAARFFSRVINDNRYPAFYIFDEQETVPKVMAYVRSLAKEGAPEAGKSAKDDFGGEVQKWLSDYENYDQQINDLVKTRVSLAYNLDLLKKYKSEAPDIDRVNLHFYKNGEFEESVFTFRQEDDNLGVLIRDIDTEIDRFDGGFFPSQQRENDRLGFGFVSEGVIRNRVLEQARLRERLTILHREVEFVHQNLGKRSEFDGFTEDGQKEIEELYQTVTNLLIKEESKPSSWAVKKTSRQKFVEEFKHSIKSNKRLQQMREKSEVISNYLSEQEVSRAQLLNKGLGFFTRTAFFATPGVVTVSGLVTMFDLDEKIVNLYESYLVWKYGSKIKCVRETTDQGYIDCLYKHYENEYPDIIQMAYKDPDFNPWDFDAIREQGKIAEAIVNSYVADIQEMQKFREYYRYIQKRKIEIKQLFADQHQIIVDGAVPRPDNLAACVAVEQDQLPLCLYDTIFSQLTAGSGKFDFNFDRQSFPYDNLDEIPEDIRDEYRDKLEDILYQRSIYRDLNELDGYEMRIFFDED